MKILRIHNFYQRPGGEDEVVAQERELLEKEGHQIVRYEDYNRRITGGVLTGLTTAWNMGSFKRLRSLIAAERPDVAHFHNTFPLISPSGYYAAGSHGIPVVQTLHNFRLLCPAATFLRNGKVCETCPQERSFLPAIRHRCYHDSTAASAAVAAMLSAHRIAGTWTRSVDLYIASSEFMRRKFVEFGFPQQKIVVKPNSVLPDPGRGVGGGAFALFVGRLAEEKGIQTLIAAWRTLRDIPLKVAGDGPLRQMEWPSGVTVLGQQSRDEIVRLMQSATVLIFPSVWFEGQPMTLLEALACGLPTVASNIGGIPELIDHQRTGLLFRPGDHQELASCVRWAFAHPEELNPMRAEARQDYENKHAARHGFRSLMEIYETAIERRRKAA